MPLRRAAPLRARPRRLVRLRPAPPGRARVRRRARGRRRRRAGRPAGRRVLAARRRQPHEPGHREPARRHGHGQRLCRAARPALVVRARAATSSSSASPPPSACRAATRRSSPACARPTRPAIRTAAPTSSTRSTETIRIGMDCPDFVIDAPLLHRTKAQTWALADELGVLELVRTQTHSCYEGVRGELHEWGHGCGACPACETRARGWAEFRAADRSACHRPHRGRLDAAHGDARRGGAGGDRRRGGGRPPGRRHRVPARDGPARAPRPGAARLRT